MIIAALTYIACIKVVFIGMEKMRSESSRIVTVKKGRELK